MAEPAVVVVGCVGLWKTPGNLRRRGGIMANVNG